MLACRAWIKECWWMNDHKKNISSQHCGKWILAGEHILVRGGPALSFPLKDLFLEVQYKPNQPLSFCFEGEFSDCEKNKYFEKAIKEAFSSVGRKPEGHFYLSSKIPLGFGLGSSAAFCLSLSDIFVQLGYVRDLVDFAWKLEDFFHGKSSGSDIQAVYHKKPLIFKSAENFEFFEPQQHPHIYLYNTGISSSTKQCVEKVSDIFNQHPEKSQRIYKQMEQSVNDSIKALSKSSKEDGLALLTQSITRACECFEDWDLLEPLRPSIKKLKSLGALAVKPTGAGAGGYLIGLWKDPQPAFMKDKNFLSVSF